MEKRVSGTNRNMFLPAMTNVVCAVTHLVRNKWIIVIFERLSTARPAAFDPIKFISL